MPGLNKIARKLDIDCVPAMVGWEAHCGFSHPILDGFVVCAEFEETLLDAWNRQQEEEEKKEREVSDCELRLSQSAQCLSYVLFFFFLAEARASCA